MTDENLCNDGRCKMIRMGIKRNHKHDNKSRTNRFSNLTITLVDMVVITYLVAIAIIIGIYFWGGMDTVEKNEEGIWIDIRSWVAMVVSLIIPLGIAIVLFYYSSKQTDAIKKVTEQLELTRESKQKKYAKIILSALNMIDFEIDGIKTQHKFLKATPAGEIQKEQSHRDSLINHYSRIQMMITKYSLKNIDSDTLLEVFDTNIEEQYTKAWSKVAIHSDIYTSTGDYKLDFLMDQIDESLDEFRALKELVMPFLSVAEKKRYEKVFDPERFNSIRQRNSAAQASHD